MKLPLNVAALESSTPPPTHPQGPLVAGVKSSRAWAWLLHGRFPYTSCIPYTQCEASDVSTSGRLDILLGFATSSVVTSFCIRWLSLPLLLVQISVSSSIFFSSGHLVCPTNSFHLTRDTFLLKDNTFTTRTPPTVFMT